MRKIFLTVLLMGLVFVPVEIRAESSFLKAWNQWVMMRKAVWGGKRINRSVSIPRIDLSKNDLGEVEKENVLPEISERKKSLLTRRYSIPRYTRKPVVLATESKVRAQVLAIKPRKNVHEITSVPLKVFEVGVRSDTEKNSLKYQEAILMDSARFKLFDNKGIAADVRGFKLVVGGNSYDFDDDGRVEIPLNHVRVPRGGVYKINVYIALKDPSMTPHVGGELRLRMEGMTAYGESSRNKIKGFIYGSTVSHKMIFDPVPVVNAGEVSDINLGESKTIYGKALSEGDEELVLIGKFAANYDDLYLREVTLRNTLTGADIDPLVYEIRAINLESGLILGRSRFTRGVANIKLRPEVFIGRGDQVRVGFQVVIEDRVEGLSLDPRFKLELRPEDIVVQSISTGNTLSTSAKHFTIDSEEFTVSQGQMVLAPASRQYSYAVGTNRPETVFRFNIGGGEAMIGRVSFDVFPSGMEFAGGSLSSDDIALVRIVGSREHVQSVGVNVTGANSFAVDFNSPYIKDDGVVEFGLRLAFDNLSGNDDADVTSIRILGDSQYQKGTLTQLRSSGRSFIWADDSSYASSSNWFSGYNVSGIPSNTAVVRRFEN